MIPQLAYLLIFVKESVIHKHLRLEIFRPLTELWMLGNKHSLELVVSENRKQEKTYVNARIHYAFLTLTERWIVENSVFCEIYQRLALWKIRENTGFQSLTPDEREVLLPENICERKQTTHPPSVNRPVDSSKRTFSAVHWNGKLPDNGTNPLIHR